MAYACWCKDVPESAGLRKANTADHLAYIESILDKVLIAGPLSADGAYTASCFIYAVDQREEALALLQADPYYRAGVYAEVDCREFLPAAGDWIGGTVWQTGAR